MSGPVDDIRESLAVVAGLLELAQWRLYQAAEAHRLSPEQADIDVTEQLDRARRDLALVMAFCQSR